MLDKCPYIHERVKTTKSTVSHSIALQTALFHNKETLAKFLLPLVFSFTQFKNGPVLLNQCFICKILDFVKYSVLLRIMASCRENINKSYSKIRSVLFNHAACIIPPWLHLKKGFEQDTEPDYQVQLKRLLG